jgi:acetyltransferase-like isoleucine patch superfamily enzyme
MVKECKKNVIGKDAYIGKTVILGHPGKGDKAALLSGDWSKLEGTKVGDKCIIREGTIVYSSTSIGEGSQTGHFALIRENVKIGKGCVIGTTTVIENEVAIGDRVSIQSGVFIPTYTTIEDDVFVGPRVCFTNDKYMGRTPQIPMKGAYVEKGARIGANSTILPGIRIGKDSVIGSASVVTHDVEPYSVVCGNPARKVGTVPKEHRRF